MEIKEIKEQLEGLKTDLLAKMADTTKAEVTAQLTEIKSKLDEVEGKVTTAKDDEIKSLKSTIDKLTSDLEATVKGLEIVNARVKSVKQVAVKTPASFQEQLATAMDEKHDEIQKFIRKESKRVEMEIKAVADVSTANVTGGTVYGAIYKPGIIENPNQINHIRTFIRPVAAGPGTDYYFMRENGAGEGAPAFVAEKKAASASNVGTGLKPQFDIDLVEASVPFQILAGYMVASRKSLNNIPAFQNFLNTRIPEKLLDVEDAGILYGTGTSPEIKGILVSGNYVASTSTATKLSEKIIDDIALLEDTYKRAAAGVWMRPVDYWSFWKEKATGGSEEYNLPGCVVWVGSQLYIGGVPVYKTTALNSGDYFVGAAMGADLLVQESMRIEFFEQDGTNVRTNQVTIRVEETIALPVYGDDYFVLGSTSGS